MSITTPEEAVRYLENEYGTVNILTSELRNDSKYLDLFPIYIQENFLQGTDAFMQALYTAGYRDEVSYTNDKYLLLMDQSFRFNLVHTIRFYKKSNEDARDFLNLTRQAIRYAKSLLLAKDLLYVLESLGINHGYRGSSLVDNTAEEVLAFSIDSLHWINSPTINTPGRRGSLDGKYLLIDSNLSNYQYLKSLESMCNSSYKANYVYKGLLEYGGIAGFDFFDWSNRSKSIANFKGKYNTYKIGSSANFYIKLNLPIEKIKEVSRLPLIDYYNLVPEVHQFIKRGYTALFTDITLSDYWEPGGYSQDEEINTFVAKMYLRNFSATNRVKVTKKPIPSTHPNFLLTCLRIYAEHHGTSYTINSGNSNTTVYQGSTLPNYVLKKIGFVAGDYSTCKATPGYRPGEASYEDLFAYLKSTYRDPWVMVYAYSKSTDVLDLRVPEDARLAEHIAVYSKTTYDERISPFTKEELAYLQKFRFAHDKNSERLYSASMSAVYGFYKEAGLESLANDILDSGEVQLPFISCKANVRHSGYTKYVKPPKNRQEDSATNYTPIRVPQRLEAMLDLNVIHTKDYEALQALLSYYIKEGTEGSQSHLKLSTVSCVSLGYKNLLSAKNYLTNARRSDVSKLWCIYGLANVGVLWACDYLLKEVQSFEQAGILNRSDRRWANWLRAISNEIRKYR